MSIVKTISEVLVDGYGAGEVDFLTQLQQLDPQVALDVQNLIVQPIVDAEQSDGSSVVMQVQGHSDRDDTAGLSREERRLSELNASVNRTNNALDTLLGIVQFQLPTFPADWAFSAHIAVMPVACGGADLLESSAALSDEQRRRNRRVRLIVARFDVV